MKTKLNLILFCYIFLTSISQAAEIVIAAGEPGTSSTGVWYSATGATLPYNGNRGVYTLAGGTIETYTFAATIPETTQYAVEVYNSCYSPRSHQVIHRINHADGVDTHIVEQDCNDDPQVGQWRFLGTYNFTAGSTGSLVIDTTNSNNVYIGATAVRFVYNSTNNNPPTISTPSNQFTVNEGDLVQLTATAQDIEDGNLTASIQWSALGQSANGGSFALTAGNVDFAVTISVTDSNGVNTLETVNVTVIANQPPSQNTPAVYDFECTTPLQPLVGFTTNNASVLPDVGMRCGRYTAELLDNTGDRTLHFNNQQGRFDGVLLSFPFRVIARNLGIAPMNQPNIAHQPPGSAYNFAGIQVHQQDLNGLNSAHVVVGQRGGTVNTIEGKMTLNGTSSVTDIGDNVLPNGRADLMIVGQSDGTLLVYWQQPNLTGNPINDSWIAYDDYLTNPPGVLPGDLPDWGVGNIYVGIITYAQGTNGVPFMGVMDSLEIVE